MIRNSALLTAFILLASCRGTTNEQKTAAVIQITKDSSYIFNGHSLEGWEITNFGPQGPVSASGDEIILGMGDGCTGITYKKPFPEINYIVTLEAKRVSGIDFFCGMTFPVGKEACTLIVGGWAGTTVGLSSINGLDASENETTRLMKFDTDKWYRIALKVTADSIKAWIDDSLIVDFGKGNRKLSIRPEVELSKPFGIASWNTTAALRNIKVQDLKK